MGYCGEFFKENYQSQVSKEALRINRKWQTSGNY